ncbi:MAG: hypothetical protein GY866_34515 [Proteobacteria bacterium]|nr:hypothetical protein [Pseudomonadota bacterium]
MAMKTKKIFLSALLLIVFACRFVDVAFSAEEGFGVVLKSEYGIRNLKLTWKRFNEDEWGIEEEEELGILADMNLPVLSVSNIFDIPVGVMRFTYYFVATTGHSAKEDESAGFTAIGGGINYWFFDHIFFSIKYTMIDLFACNEEVKSITDNDCLKIDYSFVTDWGGGIFIGYLDGWGLEYEYISYLTPYSSSGLTTDIDGTTYAVEAYIHKLAIVKHF